MGLLDGIRDDFKPACWASGAHARVFLGIGRRRQWKFPRVLRALVDIVWSGSSVRNVQKDAPNLYADYQEGLQYRDDAEEAILQIPSEVD